MFTPFVTQRLVTRESGGRGVTGPSARALVARRLVRGAGSVTLCIRNWEKEFVAATRTNQQLVLG